ncbi:hypothetical protein DY000_02031522 [Brassica cretica]|uniref:Uncharacterized protein n=1 Tax=Brassica cretica TaxID=69181 RepID=A0ABQ7DED1_BRACR|nr:hypothetical protein DY000_02031522 [Brassica cretica]
MYMSKASQLSVPKHQRPPIWTEEAAGFHKRMKRIHDPVKIVVPCTVVEVGFPIPPDKSMQLSPCNGVLDDPLHAEDSQRGLQFRDEVDKGPTEAASIDTDRMPSNDTNKPESIDATTSPSIDIGRISEQKEFDVCGNLRDGDTTTRSEKSWGKKRRDWKKRKRTRMVKGKMIQGRRVDIPAAIDDNMPLSVDRASRVSIDRHLTVSIDAFHQRSGIEFLQTPGRTPASGSPLEGTPPCPSFCGTHKDPTQKSPDELPEATQREAELQRQIDDQQGQVTGLHRAREEANPELSWEFQILKEKLNEHSKQLEENAEKLSQLESENLTPRDENQALNVASNKKRRLWTLFALPPMKRPNSGVGASLPTAAPGGEASTREKAKDARTYDGEDSDSEPEPDKEASYGAARVESPMIAHLHQMFSDRIDAMQFMVERLPGVAPPIRKSNPDSYADTPFTDEITLIEMPRKFSFPV